MSTENDSQSTSPNAPKVTPPPKAKEPVFDNPADNIKAPDKDTLIHNVSDKAQAKLHSVEDNFVSLSSQRQINLILGSLIIIAALTAGLGILISIIIGAILIFQAMTGNMILNDFIDTMDEKHKRWFVPILFGIFLAIVVAYIIFGFVGVED